MEIKDDERFQTCCHEAGHLVVAHAFGLELRGALVGEGNGGIAFYDSEKATDAQKTMFMLGGLVACNISGRDHDQNVADSESDLDKASDYMMRGTTGSTVQEYIDVVRKMLTERWPAVAMLATALYERGSIPGGECKGIIDRALVKRVKYFI